MKNVILTSLCLVFITIVNISATFSQYQYDRDLMAFSRRLVEDARGKEFSRLVVINIRNVYTGDRTIFSKVLEEDLTNKFIQIEEKTFSMVEFRLEEVLKRLGLQMSALYDPQRRQEFGRLVGADAILTGSYRRNEDDIRINFQLISVATGEALAAYDLSLPLKHLPEEYLPDEYRQYLKERRLEAQRRRSKLGLVMRSAVLPGWGQYDGGHYTKGTLFFLTELGLGGGAWYLHDLRLKSPEKRIRYRDEFQGVLYGIAAVYVLNLIDAFVFSPKANP